MEKEFEKIILSLTEAIEKEDKQKDEVSSRDDNIANKDSLVIEKPNYDFIETLTEEQRKKIFKIERNN